MKPEIKNRIEQIKNGETPEGYKKTCVGKIPITWNINLISDVIEKLESGTSVNSNFEINTGYYILKTSAISNGIVNLIESKSVIDTEINRLKCPVKKDSIIISRMNTPDLVGACGYNNISSQFHYLPDRLWQTIKNPNKTCSFKFLNYLLNSDRYKHCIKSMATGTSNSMKNISKESFLGMLFSIPPIEEQQKIAEILTVQDKVIELKEKLITEKERQKKYLMQQLLTGKKRLKGFSGEWKKVKLGYCITEQNNRNKDLKISNVLSVSNKYGFINQDEQFGKTIASKDLSNYKIITKNTIAYNPSRINVGSIAKYYKNDIGIVSPMYVSMQTKDNLNSDYFMLFARSGEFFYKMKALLSGSVRDTLNFSDLCRMKFMLPPLDEQNAIVEILSKADKEIELLKQDLEQEKLKKKALMQLLLTGIVRV